jgi:hypothetical protein
MAKDGRVCACPCYDRLYDTYQRLFHLSIKFLQLDKHDSSVIFALATTELADRFASPG